MDEITAPSEKKHKPPPGMCWKNVGEVFLKLVAGNRIWFGKNGDGVPRRKILFSESEGVASWTWWTNAEVGHSQEAKKEVNALVAEGNAFGTPKPVRLIGRILDLASGQTALVLDSFA